MTSRPIPKPSGMARSRVILLAITISATTIFLLTIIYILYHLWSTLLHQRSRTNPFSSSSTTTPLKLQHFSYKELKSATNGFNPDNSIGKGGIGTVFRGILPDGKSVAIKKLDVTCSVEAEREFQSEITIVGALRSSPHIVSLLGYCIEKNKRVLVYEYMPNGSLQELLFNSDHMCLNWEKRFQIIEDVARAVEFLHNECDPPVIHGDIKPSNVLLDWDFKAKISDFGLSRVKVEEEDDFGVEMFSQELWKSQELSGNLNEDTFTPIPQTVGTPIEGQEVDFALALQASSSTKQGRAFHGSPKGKEVMVEENDQELLSSVDHSKELELTNLPSLGNYNGMDDAFVGDATTKQQWGKDWWWKQDDGGSGELCSKDYVNEWIGSQVCPSSNPDWKNSSLPVEPNLGNSPQLGGCLDDDQKGKFEETKEKNNHNKNKPRKMQDWWKEEEQQQLDEITKKGSSKRKMLEKKMKNTIKMPHFDLGRRFYILKKRGRVNQTDGGDHLSHEFSFRRSRKHKHTRSTGSEMSGDLFSRELSSTTSMRGTLCYVAPEYGGGGCGGGYLMEKADIYSLGVLILVIVSGRRPLHVLSSPMKLEKANLISWCRQLAQAGNVLELVDERLKDAYNKEQASLCIHLALACLQRMPELRPDIGEIVRILRGDMNLPPLPFEFSPSPPSKFYSRSRRKT